MKSRKICFLGMIAVLVIAVSNCKSSPLAEVVSEAKIIGGYDVRNNPSRYAFPASVGLEACSATRIHPNYLLTAAHCIELMRPYSGYFYHPRDPRTANPAQVMGLQIRFTHPTDPQKRQWFTVPLADVFVYPAFILGIQEWQKTHPGQNWQDHDHAFLSLPDLALIKISPDGSKLLDAHDVLIANFTPSPLPLGTPVLIDGYGCEEDQFATDAELDATVNKSGLDFTYSKFAYTMIAQVFADISYVTTYRNLGEGRGCDGDSGGGVFLPPQAPAGDGLNPVLQLVGVTGGSTMQFEEGQEYDADREAFPNAVPFGIIRLDQANRFHTLQWIHDVIKLAGP